MHKLSERNVYTDNLFDARSFKILTKNAFLARFRKHNSCKINARNEKVLQEFCKIYFQIHQSCKICIFYENFPKVVLIARILQDFCKNCFSCELGNVLFKYKTIYSAISVVLHRLFLPSIVFKYKKQWVLPNKIKNKKSLLHNTGPLWDPSKTISQRWMHVKVSCRQNTRCLL